MKLLVTGGAGFIGSHFIRHLLESSNADIVNVDKLTYAGHLENLKAFRSNPHYRFVRGDITSIPLIDKLMSGVDAVVNFAAETHVDRSIHDASPFLRSNIIGTHVLLESARRAKVKRFLQISTDEVYGSIARGEATESSPINPSSPYAASKTSADHLALSYWKTFGFPVVITRASNNYGPFQYPEKFLPLFITHALADKKLPLYGDGLQQRDWLHVTDHCTGIERVLKKGRLGEVYNIGAENCFTNKEVAQMLLKRLHKPKTLIQHVPDRLGHDRRYAMSSAKIRRELGWRPAIRFEQGFDQLIDWYIDHRSWWEPILFRSKKYKAYFAKQYAKGLK